MFGRERPCPVDMVGTNPEPDLAAPPWEPFQSKVRREERPVLDPPGDDVHGGTADECPNKLGGGLVVDVPRGPPLLDHPGSHHHDFVGKGHGLLLVVSDVYDGALELPLDAENLRSCVRPQL